MNTESPNRSSVRVHIERLVLDGLPLSAREGRELQAALEHHLATLLRDQPDVASNWTAAALASSGPHPVTLAPSGGPEGIGQQLASAVHAAISPARTGATHVEAGPLSA